MERIEPNLFEQSKIAAGGSLSVKLRAMTLLEFEKNAEAVIVVLENSTSIIDQWSNDLSKFSGASCWTIPQRTRNDVIKILESFHPFADAFPEIFRFLTIRVPQYEFESKVEKRYSDIIKKSKEIIGKCGQGPNNTPLNPAMPNQEMTELRRCIEMLVGDLRFCVKIAREDLAVGMQPANGGKAGDGGKKPEAENTLGNISGMAWQEAQKKAERIIDECGFRGFMKLKAAVGCKSKKTLRKAIKNSTKLTKAEKQYKATSGTLKAFGLTKKLLATHTKERPTQSPKELKETEIDKILDEMHAQVDKEKGPQEAKKFKKELNTMSREKQKSLAQTYQNTPIFHEPKEPRQYKKV